MRPLKLEIEGFTAFRDPVSLDLTDLDLFAITGPTGAGKSSIIDAVSYALYGRVPRVTTEVASCISQGMERMQVSLEFRAGGECYRIHRETRRKGQGNVRLERMRGEGWQALVDRVRDVNTHVAEIVGLDYDGFTRSVILPQGQFQELLAGSAEKRRAVLRSLLRLEVYDRMRDRASAISRDLKTRVEEREGQLQQLAEATPENVARLEEQLAEASKQVTCLQDEQKHLNDALTQVMTLNQTREALARCTNEAAAAQDGFTKAQKVVEDGDEALEALTREQQTLQEQLDANAYDPERHRALDIAKERAMILAQTRAGIEQATAQHDDATRQMNNAGAAVDKATKALATAEAELGEAESARSEAQRHDLAAALQQQLQPGDACPVCGGVVGEVAVLDATDLEAASKRHAAARKTETDARSSLNAATNAATLAAANAEGYESRKLELESQMEGQRRSVLEVLPQSVDATPEAIEAALKEYVAALTVRKHLEASLKETAEKAQTGRDKLYEARQRLAALEQRSRSAGQALDAAQSAVAAARDAVVAVIGEAWPEVATGLRDDLDVESPLRRRLEAAQASLGQVQTSIGQMGADLKHLKAGVEKAEALKKELHGLKKEQDVAADLAQMLGAAKFQQFLQYEALRTLASDGSTRLEQLSNGRYRLRVDDKGAEFEVIDTWNADQARSVKTLSGGETFLASLALSLALAESLPGLAAGRRVLLDSIFLDEGFGSLDAEALDRVADALDSLREEARMVCIVTHLPELAQRLPARVVVTKTDSGSSVAVV